MPRRNRPGAADSGAAVRPDAVGRFVRRAYVLLPWHRGFVEGAGSRGRGGRARGHASFSCADRSRTQALNAGKLHYGAAVVALQWLALNREHLREIAEAGAAR